MKQTVAQVSVAAKALMAEGEKLVARGERMKRQGAELSVLLSEINGNGAAKKKPTKSKASKTKPRTSKPASKSKTKTHDRKAITFSGLQYGQMRQMRKAGKSYAEIGKAFGVSLNTIARQFSRGKVPQ